jgi:putative glutamine amidotransferase
MKSAPTILITPSTQIQGAEFLDSSISLSDRYSGAIVAAGGIPWIMPCFPNEGLIQEMVRRCDGVLLTGGDDIQPQLYRKTVPKSLAKTVGATAPHRDLTELLVIRETLAARKPLLGICRGMQLLNVALGGTLFVDIKSQVAGAIRHDHLDKKDKLVHDTSVASNTLLQRVLGTSKVGVNSTHHQAVDRLGQGLAVSGVSPDGVVEAVELEPGAMGDYPYLLGVQFHPERLFEEHAVYRKLFLSFVNACVA